MGGGGGSSGGAKRNMCRTMSDFKKRGTPRRCRACPTPGAAAAVTFFPMRNTTVAFSISRVGRTWTVKGDGFRFECRNLDAALLCVQAFAIAFID